MRIESLSDIVNQLEIKKNGLAQCVEAIGTRLSKAANVPEFSFTHLQREAFNKPGFWLKDTREVVQPHLIIQGATSSGKTLVSEMAIIECLNAQRSAIVLVPLKAMVRERREYLKKDMPEMKIYASSGDFQDNDDRIINGDFHVAIIVYEKFFAMLSQASAKILDNCALLVVDELQMLSSVGRGPKLEIAIQKVMRHNAELGADEPHHNKTGREYPFTRIMCLTTCDCSVSSIQAWLKTGGKKPVHISSSKRPVGLEEYVIHLDGTMRGQYTRGEQDAEAVSEAFRPQPKPLTVPGYSKDNRVDNAKKLLLTALLKKLYTENQRSGGNREFKVLVFVSARTKTEDIAHYIFSQHIFPTETLSEEMNAVLDAYDNDDNLKQLRVLLQQRIAIHNASMSVALRDFVETEFQGEVTTALNMKVPANGVNLVVATETLTVGMNMPVDVVILFDSEVPRGTQKFEPLTSQEYKNYVGRAGRLGQTNRVGKSYLFVSGYNVSADLDNAVSQYINCSQEDITSALRTEQERMQAPYYLSLLSRGYPYTNEDLEKIKNSSFSKFCGGRVLEIGKLCAELQSCGLCAAVDENEDIVEAGGGGVYAYIVQDLGALVAPYALSLSTVKKLRQRFLVGGAGAPGKGGIPRGITAEDLNCDKYLLDILYVLCTTAEIRGLSQLHLPPDDRNPDKNREAKNQLMKCFQSLTGRTEEEPAQCQLWENSKLKTFLENPFAMENRDFQDIMRAILLWCWTKGMTVDEIRKTTGFKNVSLCTGDISRMAEVAAFQMEAVKACTSINTPVNYTQESIHALYALSTRINYGMPRDLVIIANRHLLGLDRKSVLAIGKAAKKFGYDNPVQFLERAAEEQLANVITAQQRSELLARIDRIYLRDNIDMLLDQIQKNSRGITISSAEADCLKQLAASKTGPEPDGGPLRPLQALFGEEAASAHFFQDGRYIPSGDLSGMLRFNKLNLTLGIYQKTNDQEVKDAFLACGSDQINLLLVHNEDAGVLADLNYDALAGTWKLCADSGGKLIDNISLAMTLTTFAGLLIQSVSLDDRKAERLRQFLRDCSGCFAPTGLSSLHHLLKNYGAAPESIQVSGSGIRILCDYRKGGEQDFCELLMKELSHARIPYRILSWGEPLRNEAPGGELTLLYLTSESKKASRSVRDFCTKLYKHHEYTSAVAVFDNSEQFVSWSGDPAYPEKRIPHFETTDFTRIAHYVSSHYRHWLEHKDLPKKRLIGISYSHTPEKGQERTAVIWFKKIVERLNELYGEDRILFDGNECCKDLFDGNKAIPQTLELYKQCSYFLILDDSCYLDGPSCPREASAIAGALKEMPPQHAWFITPENDRRGDCFGTDDYSHRLRYEEASVDEITAVIQRAIEL